MAIKQAHCHALADFSIPMPETGSPAGNKLQKKIVKNIRTG
jgi:hypothetical protein